MVKSPQLKVLSKRSLTRKTILITGAGGYIGRYLVKYFLSKEFSVHALIRSKSPFNPQPHLKIFPGDIRDLQSVSKASHNTDIIIHLAAAKSDEQDSQAINVTGTQNILKQKAAKVILVSTISAKLDQPGLYGKTKRMADDLALNYPKAIIIRPSVIYSQELEGIFGTLARLTHKKLVPVFGNGETIFEPIHLEDLARVIELLILTKEPKQRIYDIGGLKKISLNDLILRIAEAQRQNIKIIHLPIWLGLFAAKSLNYLMAKPPLTVSNILGGSEQVPILSNQFVEEFNFKPRDLDLAIKEVFEASDHYLNKEAQLLFKYITTTFNWPLSNSPESYQNYICLIQKHHLDMPLAKVYFRFPILLGGADFMTRIFWKDSQFQKKLYIGCALWECSPQSADPLLPKNLTLTNLILDFFNLSFKLTLKFGLGLILLPKLIIDEK